MQRFAAASVRCEISTTTPKTRLRFSPFVLCFQFRSRQRVSLSFAWLQRKEFVIDKHLGFGAPIKAVDALAESPITKWRYWFWFFIVVSRSIGAETETGSGI